MNRAVLADHVMFSEAISAFRPQHTIATSANENVHIEVYLLSTFELDSEYKTQKFILKPTERMRLFAATEAILQPVQLSEDPYSPNSSYHIGQATAAILTMASERSITSPRDQVFRSNRNLGRDDKIRLATEGLFISAGPGAITTRLPSGLQLILLNRAAVLTDFLLTVEYGRYEEVMRILRLYQLAITLKRTDFDLAYSLLIASIEAAATLLIGRGISKVKDTIEYSGAEEKIQAFCINSGDKDLRNWFNQSIDKQSALRARFLKYLLRNVNTKLWNEVRHPLQHIIDTCNDIQGSRNFEHIVEKCPTELYPDDLGVGQLTAVLKDTYDYRSNFVHEGKATPHSQPNSMNRYFDKVHVFDGKNINEVVLITFDALATLARVSLFNSLDELRR